VTQQRHKVKLNEINEFKSEPINNGEEISAKNSLISSIFSQINPFAQFVIQDIFQETEPTKPTESEQTESSPPDAIWTLHESLFKRNPQHQVNPDNLKKTSSQMFSVYKYYENPSLQVKSPYYTKKDDFVEVRELVPQIKFFDAPG